MDQTKETLQVTAFELILHSGNARTRIHEAYDLMEKNEFTAADQKLLAAHDELIMCKRLYYKIMRKVKKLL